MEKYTLHINCLKPNRLWSARFSREIAQEVGDISLDIVGDSCKTSSDKVVTISEASLIRKYGLQKCPPAHTDHDYCDAPTLLCYVANMAEKKIICSQCSSAVKALNQKPLEASDFVQFKSRGGLTLASPSVCN